jgi:hypothetical protein
VINLFVRLFPRDWWARYGDEFLALLDDQPPGRRRWADILRCLIAAHIDRSPRPASIDPGQKRRVAIPAILAGLAVLALLFPVSQPDILPYQCSSAVGLGTACDGFWSLLAGVATAAVVGALLWLQGRRNAGSLAIWLLILLAIAVSAAFIVALVGALLLHQVLVLTVGEEGIPSIDGTLAMTALLFADYAVALVAGLAVFAFGWTRFVRPRI